MAKFAVYTIPPADSDLYQRGSEILGYDVRSGEFLPEENATREALPEFHPDWVAQPQTYGFHMTTGYSLYFDMETLPQIEAAMEVALGCFGRDAEFVLTPDPEERIPLWHDEIFVIHCQPNPAMLMLHTMMTVLVNPLGKSSNYSQRYEQQDPSELDPVKLHRVRHFFTPHMLDAWVPHFSLMYPYGGSYPEATQAALLELFGPEPIVCDSVCLVVREDDETHYRLHREFFFKDYPG